MKLTISTAQPDGTYKIMFDYADGSSSVSICDLKTQTLIWDAYRAGLIKAETQTRGMKTEKETKEIAEYINAQYLDRTVFKLVPYLEEDEYGDEWKLQIVDMDKKILIKHLVLDKSHGHTLRMTLSYVTESFDCGIKEGQLSLVAGLTTEVSKIFGLDLEGVRARIKSKYRS